MNDILEKNINSQKYCFRIDENNIFIVFFVKDEYEEFEVSSLDIILQTHYYIWRKKLNELNKYKQLSELTKLTLCNTKRNKYELYMGLTPYINEIEIEMLFKKIMDQSNLSFFSLLEWKCKQYNLILTQELDLHLSKLRTYCSISSAKAEYNTFKNYDIKSHSKANNEKKIQVKTKLQLLDDSLAKDRDCIKTYDVIKYIKTKGKSVYLDIPEIENIDIIVDYEDSCKIDFLIYVNKSFMIKRKEKLNERKSKSTLNEYDIIDYNHHLFNEIYKKVQNRNELITEGKLNYSNSYHTEITNSNDSLDKLITGLISNYNLTKNNYTHLLKHIKGYSWDDLGSVISLYDKTARNKKKRDKIIIETTASIKIQGSESQISKISERIYGSHSVWWDIEIKDDLKISFIKNKIKERHEAIQYLTENTHLDAENSKYYSRKLLKYLMDEDADRDQAGIKNNLVCYYSDGEIKLLNTKNYAFELAYNTTSTIKRLQTLMNWNEISSCPKFLLQKSFSHYFGFEFKELNDFYDKICSSFKLGGTYFMENKLHLVTYLKNKIDSSIKILIPRLILRLNAEKVCKREEYKNYDLITDFTENEARLYSITMLYIYIMACMKCPSFNPDGVLRMRLVCIKHKKRVQDSIHSNVCPCLYGMDEETVIYLLDRRTKREEIISIEKAKWFEETDDKESFELKHERKEEVLQYIKKMPYNESIWKDLEKVWGFEIV